MANKVKIWLVLEQAIIWLVQMYEKKCINPVMSLKQFISAITTYDSFMHDWQMCIPN